MKVIVVTIVGAVGCLAAFIYGLYTLSENSAREFCLTQASDAGLEGRYSFYGRCQVRIGDRWVPGSLVRFEVSGKVSAP
ncbi:hypothetical protein MicloDRAFT_00064550 [Microvirga lotononidis]|uniref:Integral membrane protein n=1 Tax=Microvirga lotononidis TaxID=864069 RepID=I4YP36_9HYPH|nr:hypothetical protein MicloDRAFT_00064550 [Microvirga lotononidis]